MQKYKKYFEFDVTLLEIILCLEKFYLGKKMMIRVAVASDVKEFGKVDVTLLWAPTRNIPETAQQYLSLGIHTVDSFDIHGDTLWSLRSQLDKTTKKHI